MSALIAEIQKAVRELPDELEDQYQDLDIDQYQIEVVFNINTTGKELWRKTFTVNGDYEFADQGEWREAIDELVENFDEEPPLSELKISVDVEPLYEDID